jgi:ribosomal protein S20
MDRRTKSDIRTFIKAIQKSVTEDDYVEILEKATQPTVESIKVRVPIANKPIKRYISKTSSRLSKKGKKQDKPVAIYYPGNLRRSIKVLQKLNKSKKNSWRFRKVWFGVHLHKGKSDGHFRGDRTDAYYAHMIEYGTENITPVGYFRKGVNSGAHKSLSAMQRLVSAKLNRKYRKYGLK